MNYTWYIARALDIGIPLKFSVDVAKGKENWLTTDFSLKCENLQPKRAITTKFATPVKYVVALRPPNFRTPDFVVRQRCRSKVQNVFFFWVGGTRYSMVALWLPKPLSERSVFSLFLHSFLLKYRKLLTRLTLKLFLSLLFLILGLFGYFSLDGSPTFVLALGGVQLPLPVLQWS